MYALRAMPVSYPCQCLSMPGEPSAAEDVLRVLDDWHHPDLVIGEVPSQTETFRQLAAVAVTGDAARHDTTEVPNTHWSNWPGGGQL